MIALTRLSAAEERALLRADAAAPAAESPTMRDRIRERLRNRVHDVLAMEARHASAVGDTATEHTVGCALPEGEMLYTDRDLGDGLGPLPHARGGGMYPSRLGWPAMIRRKAWLAEHRQRLRALERS